MSKFNNEYVKGVLRTEGTRFVNEDGQEIILHGYGTANWMNVEGFMIGEPPVASDMFKYIPGISIFKYFPNPVHYLPVSHGITSKLILSHVYLFKLYHKLI